MRKIFYSFCFISQIIISCDTPICTEDMVNEIQSDVYEALKEFACTSVGTSFENSFYEQYDAFENILQEKDNGSREDFVDRLAELYSAHIIMMP